MHKKAKKGVGQSKNFGPIQKLTVPDFQHITNVYEQMQSEILEKPAKARKQMKPFTIRKAAAPARGRPAGGETSNEAAKYATAPQGDRQNMSASGILDGEESAGHYPKQDVSNLSKEELEALQPKGLRVVNPWIHEQTHKQYLTNITGLPARHANVIKQHKHVVKETTFLPDDDKMIDKDKATREALAILDGEYEIFNDANMLPVKALPRYDTWDQDRTIEEWLEYCRVRPDQPHAISPQFVGQEYAWKPVQVLDYDYTQRKYLVRVMHTKQEKLVTRLSLLFYAEDPELFKERVNLCKTRQKNVEAELRFTALVDSIPPDAVSVLSKERRESFLKKCISENDKFESSAVYNTFSNLMRVVQEEYIRQMKKCIVMKEMHDPSQFAKFEKLKVPIRINKKTSPYFGVVRCPKYNFLDYQNEILKIHWCSDPSVADLTRIFSKKCIEFLSKRFMQTDRKYLALPLKLSSMKEVQKEHYESIQKNMKNEWREFLVSEIRRKLREAHNIFESVEENYKKSQLKRIIVRFELILNSFLREFVSTSITDWVAFVKSFTIPKYEQDELWPLSQNSLLQINLSIVRPKADSKDKDKKKKKKGSESSAGEDKQISFNPSLSQCRQFIIGALKTMQDINNDFASLEKDLVTFLKYDEKPSFKLTEEFKEDYQWISDARDQLTAMIDENVVEPEALLEKYKKYEYILAINKKNFVLNLFPKKTKEEGGEDKKDIEEISEALKKFNEAEQEILNISNDVVNYPLFRVMAGDLKTKLADQANSIKTKILEGCEKWCRNTVTHIEATYQNMQKQITKPPQNEMELVELTEFIEKSRNETKQALEDLLREVEQHYCLMDEYSFMYQEQDIEFALGMKCWPSQIQETINDGKDGIAEKTETFVNKLESDKEEFARNMKTYQDVFKNIVTFHSVDTVGTFAKEAYALEQNLKDAFSTTEQFNLREGRLNQPLSTYADLDTLRKEFDPFYELLDNAFLVQSGLSEYYQNSLSNLDYETVADSVDKWHQTFFKLYRKLDEDYPEAAECSQELKKKVEEFKENLPLIKCFVSEAMHVEDWQEIREVTGKPELDKETLTVNKFHEEKLMDFLPDIEEIATRAEKKFKLQQQLQESKKTIKERNVFIFKYKDTFVIQGYDELNQDLDDQMVNVQGMLGSAYMRGRLKPETKNWETKLNNMSELVEELSKCQKVWKQLEPVFESDDIGKTLANEASMFKDVDALWRQTMTQISEEPGIMDLVERDNIKGQFEFANKQLDKITKSLNDYLEEKRLVFPRFFFLANEELLQILAQTKDPKLVQKYMEKCFEGINRLVFNEQEIVEGMISADKEEVTFKKKIDVNEGDKKGNVEKWMLEIENIMRTTLKQIMDDSIKDFYKIKRTEWVQKWPGQIVLAVDQLDWTRGVEEVFRQNAPNGLKIYNDKLKSQMLDIVDLVRGELPSGTRTTLKALVVLAQHAIYVVEEMINLEVENAKDFGWDSQLRYYWEPDKPGSKELLAKMVTAQVPYGYEYLGNSLRLVITPLTDRCYRTLMGAKTLNYGGAPEGPAGTGKTESVKDLAKALAVQCVVFNCQDGLDHNAMAKFFKGLAASGAWCCFDEFNRIDLEVLSVIAMQITTIQMAIKDSRKQFVFEGTMLNINKACAVNITMNPGYAGRSELPDNLKALFRPCAMMVPDYNLIGEIELYSFGFADARKLSVKIVASLRLSSEQLSSQDHYDFGMRALKTILTACGNLRRQLDMNVWTEDQIGLRALKDVNLPKFTVNDIPLYIGITADLFPGVELPPPDYKKLLDSMREVCTQLNLQPKPDFFTKIISLYETMIVRHGLMVVGHAFAGKSAILNVLAKAFNNIKDDPNFKNVQRYIMNPKSLKLTQLYGNFDEDTGEWTDGILAILIRNCSQSDSPDRKWIVFDGPVDTIWIENMNTVLDDNKKLCLSSGEIIKLKDGMNIMMEVDDLSVASPATISRCGMVLLEPKQLGHNVLITSYCNEISEWIPKKTTDNLEEIFQYCANVSVEFTRQNCTFPVPTHSNFHVANLLKIFDAFVRPWRKVADDEEHKVPENFAEVINNAVVFAFVWGVGAQLHEKDREKFDLFLQDLISGVDCVEKYKIQDLDPTITIKTFKNNLGNEFTSLFDICFQPADLKWIGWLKTEATYEIPGPVKYSSVIVPTIDSIRINSFIVRLLSNKTHVLLAGPTGTGKSVGVMNQMASKFENEHNTYVSLAFSAQTTANQTQRIIDGNMEKKRKGIYGPPLGKNAVIFIDDLNMPQKEKFGAQPPIELLRQWMDYQGWYDIDTPEKDFRKIVNSTFVAAMHPPVGRDGISHRYIRHFNVCYVPPYSDGSLQHIFSNVMQWIFQNQTKNQYSETVKGMKEGIVKATIQVFQTTNLEFRPTPAKSHYTYNLRDVSKVFRGINKSDPRAINQEDDMIKLWAHECLRIFHDRLISDLDREQWVAMLKSKIKEKFKKEWDSIVTVKPLLFGSFVPTIYPDGDDTKKPFRDLYCELTNRQMLKKIAEGGLEDFNNINRSKKMDLVLFTDALEHIVKIHRVITTEGGNCLLVGVGGSGRKSLTELSVFISMQESIVLDMPKGYDFAAWREDMKNNLFIPCGTEAKPIVFAFSDTQIILEAFLEDINNILNNGKIPNLYNNEDVSQIIETMKDIKKMDADFKEIAEDNTAVVKLYEETAQANLHVALTMSPIGEDFKRRLRMFPALVNCCTIDWFLPWPKDALESVAQNFLERIDDLPQIDGIVRICVDMQERVQALSVRYREELRRYYYVTPTSYLILIKTFSTFLDEKRKKNGKDIFKFDKGLVQLAKAAGAVAELQDKLTELIPLVKKQAEEAAEKQKEIEKTKIVVDKERADCQVQENDAKEQKQIATGIADECKDALAKVMPIYEAALKAVAQLQNKDVTEMSSFNQVQAGGPIDLVAKALCIFKDIKPIKIPKATAKDVDTYDYWKPCKQKVLNGQLLPYLKNYKKDEMEESLVNTLRPILAEGEFADERLKAASKAARGIGSWVRAIVQYYDAMLIVNPKKEELKVAEEKAAAAQAVWDEALARLQKVEAEMKRLVDDLDATVAKEKQLRKDKETYEQKVELANTLIGNLKNERETWSVDLEKAKIFKDNLVGDVLICSGVLAYLGVFVSSYREECVQTWGTMMKKYNIQSSADVSLKEILGNQVRISEWASQGLPSDEVCIENAIILENSERWSLMIDPQMQANLWLKQKHKGTDDLKTIKPNMPQNDIINILKNAIQHGNPVILEDATETFDPLLDPILGKQVEIQGKEKTIKVSDKVVSFSDEFIFYVTTKMDSPHYSPETCVKMTILNFMVTQEGLMDQMKNEIIRIEENAKYEKRKVCIQTAAENSRKIAEIQDKILNAIANTGDDILEDVSLKETLDQSKIQQAAIEQSNQDNAGIMKGIEKIRVDVEPVALRVSRLFFVLMDLTKVNAMYSYSLEQFKSIFEAAVRSAADEGIEKGNKSAKKAFWIKKFTEMLYLNISRSLFQHHLLLFSFLICLKIMDEVEEGGLNFTELRFFLAGATQVELTKPNPSGNEGWLTDAAWLSILEMSSKFQTYKGLDDSFIKDVKQWEKIYNSAKPQDFKENPWPEPWNNLTLIQKVTIMRSLRPDKVQQIIQKIVKNQKELGKFYLLPPTFSMENLFNDSTNKTPIIIVISPGADPMTEIEAFSTKKKIQFEQLSLGKGQGKKAVDAIKRAQTEQTRDGTVGTWIVLQNCHLAVSFMPTLDRILEEINIQADSTFRLWLTTEPSDKFPVTIVQNGIKATSEPPKGIRANMLKAYNSITNQEFEKCEKPIAFRRLLWGLCFFNSVILERRKFGPLGWNIHYAFSAADLRISTLQLINFLNDYDEVPFDALIYMVAEANYGGRVTDVHDRITIDVILRDFYNDKMINEENHKLCESGKYYVPSDGQREDYIKFIEDKIPINDLTEIFGMHDNAEITSAINQTNEMLDTALQLQPRAAGGAGKSQDEVMADLALDILNKLPPNYDVEDANRKHPIKYEDSLNTVLQQEILRFNRLLALVRGSLINIGKAIKGEIVMSPELEQVGISIFNNRVPALWMERSYPSLKPLASYVVDFLERLKFIQSWIDENAPAQMWISGFFFTQSFLTGLKQNYARKYSIAIDIIDFDFEVVDDPTKYDMTKVAPDGAFIWGLFLEGCRWDSEQHVLNESMPKVLFTKMPNIWLKPCKRDEIVLGHRYLAPVYRTLARRGTLSTTGHSTNYVITMRLSMMRRHQSSWWTKRGVALISALND